MTCLLDSGIGLGAFEDALSQYHPFVDITKFGWASALITPELGAKLAILRKHDIRPCFGGMMFEICYWQNKIDDYAAWLQDLGLEIVEVSNGSLPISNVDKCRMVERLAARGFTVLSEVGSKDASVSIAPEEWVEYIRNDLSAGAWKVITEGRADASAGIYTADGSPRSEIVDTILDSGLSADDVVFEAPRKNQMSYFIKRVGANVNLGNIPPSEILNLETLRVGLRGDTVQHFHA